MTNTTQLFEFQKEEIETARREFQDALNSPWVQRKKGIPHEWIYAPIILITWGIWIPLVISWFPKYEISSPVYMISMLMVVWLMVYFPKLIYGTNELTTRHALRKYPPLRRPIRAFREAGEKFRRHLPALVIDGRRYFMVNYHRPQDMRKYGYQKRIGIVLLNEAMQVVDNDELFEKAYLVENLSFLIAPEERTRDLRYLRDKPGASTVLRQCERTLGRYRDRFEQQGTGMFWNRLMASFPTLHAALDETTVMFSHVHERLRKALGYSFAVEFLYEDALHLDEARRAYVRHMTATYNPPLQRALGDGRMMTVSIITEQKRSDRKALLALEKLRIIEEGILGIVDRFSKGGVVQPEDWEYYHRKVELARQIGWPIASE